MRERLAAFDEWGRALAFVFSAATVLAVVVVLGLGALWVDLATGMGCFDGDEPACQVDPSQMGLAAIRTSSWVLGAIAVLSAVGAVWVSAITRRPRHLLVVMGCCAVAATVLTILYSRL